MSGAGTDVDDGAARPALLQVPRERLREQEPVRRLSSRRRSRTGRNAIAATSFDAETHGALTLVAIISSHNSGVVVSRSPRGKHAAAELTRRSTVPNSRTAASMIFVAAASPSARSTATKARAQISHDGTPDGP